MTYIIERKNRKHGRAAWKMDAILGEDEVYANRFLRDLRQKNPHMDFRFREHKATARFVGVEVASEIEEAQE